MTCLHRDEALDGLPDALLSNHPSAPPAAGRICLLHGKRLTGLRNELEQLPLPANSPLWYAFGFNRPADPATPGIPDQLVLTAGAAGSGMLIVDWASSRRATGYRVKIAVAGESEPRVFGTFADDQATIAGLPTSVELTVTVIARNPAGDSAESAAVKITLS